MSQPARTGARRLDDMRIRIRWIVSDVIERNGLSNASLAVMTGYNKKSISNYRGMHTTPDIFFIIKMNELFGVNVAWVHTGEGLPYNLPDGDVPPYNPPDDHGGDARPDSERRVERETTAKSPELEESYVDVPPLDDAVKARAASTRRTTAKMERELELLQKTVKELKSKVADLARDL